MLAFIQFTRTLCVFVPGRVACYTHSCARKFAFTSCFVNPGNQALFSPYCAERAAGLSAEAGWDYKQASAAARVVFYLYFNMGRRQSKKRGSYDTRPGDKEDAMAQAMKDAWQSRSSLGADLLSSSDEEGDEKLALH